MRRDVSVELETELVRLGGLERLNLRERLGVLEVVVVGTSGQMAVAAVLTVFDALHVQNLGSCGHHGQRVPMVSPVPHAQAQVYHGYSYLQHHPPGRYANRHTSGGDADRCSNGMGEHRVAAVAVLHLDVTAVGRASD